MNDDLRFDFEANLQPLVKAVDDATRILTSLERKLVSVARAGNLSATRADVTKFTTELTQAQAAIRAVETALQSIPSNAMVDLTVPTQLANEAVKQLNMSLNTLKKTNDLNSSTMAAVNVGLGVATKQYGAAATAVTRMSTSATKASTSSTRSATATKAMGTAANNAAPKIASVGTSLNKATKAGSSFATSGNGIVKALSRITRYAKLAVMAGLGRFFGQAVEESINYAENLNLFNVAMGDVIDTGKEFIQTIQEQYGLDPSNLMRYVGVFHQLSTAIGVSDDTAAHMSLGLTKMSVDLSSLFNMPIDTVMQNIQSGMQGMTRAVRKYGIDIRVSTIEQEALALGLHESVLTMSEANRQGLRYLTMLKQTSKATGDFAKTIESPANQLRIMQEQVSQLARAVGNLMLSAFANVLPYVNGLVMALRMVLQAMAALMGFKPLDFGGATDEAEAIGDSFTDGVGGALDDATKKAKKLIAPFDELNVLSEETASSSGGVPDMGVMDESLQAAIAEYEAKLEGIKMKANEVRDSILEFLGIEMELDADGNLEKFNFNLDTLLSNISESSGINFTPLINAFSTLWSSAQPVIDRIGKLLTWLWENVLYPFGKWLVESALPPALKVLAGAFDILRAAIDFVAPTLQWLWDVVLKPLLSWTGQVFVDGLTSVGETLIWVAELIDKWAATWEALKTKAVEVVQKIKDTFATLKEFFRTKVANPVISVINGLLKTFELGVNKMISLLNTLSFTVPDWVPEIGGRNFGFNIKPITIAQLPMLAEGGVVRDPTMAMIGEGRYDEAVIPLGNSPQVADLLSKFAEVVAARGSSEEINVTVNAVLDGEVIYTNQQKVQRNRGYDFGLGAFAR